MKKEYWSKRLEMRDKAVKHHKRMTEDAIILKNTRKSVEDSVIYDKLLVTPIPRFEEFTMQLIAQDSISAAYLAVDNTEDSISAWDDKKPSSKTAVLNFASFKHPGGMFLEGSSAQEESLCHETNLYEIISDARFMRDFYNKHKGNELNHNLYTNDSIYVKSVWVEKFGRYFPCDFITCAAPNKSAAIKYSYMSDEQVLIAMRDRIHYLLQIAALQEVDNLILGAFGCGVFGNDASDVASIFQFYLENEFAGCFKKVIFAVPNSKTNKNFEKFASFFSIKEARYKLKGK